MLEDCMAQINFILGKHNIFLGVDDRGHFSCHKINLIFVYFDPKYCIVSKKSLLNLLISKYSEIFLKKFLQDMLKNNNQQQQQTNKLNTGTTIVQNNQSQSPENNLMIIDEELLNDSNIYLTNSSGTTKQITSQKEVSHYIQLFISDLLFSFVETSTKIIVSIFSTMDTRI